MRISFLSRVIRSWFHKTRNDRNRKVLLSGFLVTLIVGMTTMSYGQATRSCGPPSRESVSSLSSKPTAASAAASKRGEWEFIPALCVSERYDSNVLFSSGGSHDYVTHVAPSLLMKHSGAYMSGTLEVSGFNETYVRNPDLNFLGSGGSLSLSLDKTIKRFLPNASLWLSDSGRYSPLPPSFLNPVAGTSPSDPANPQDAFAQGIIAPRTNNYSNTGSATFSYAITSATSLNVSYSNAITRYLSSSSLFTRVPLFDITTHTGAVGGAVGISVSDTLTARYSYSDSTFNSVTNATGGSSLPDRSFQSHTALFGWKRTWTPYFKSELGGGGIVITPGLTSWAMNAELLFTDPKYPVTLSYSRYASPSVLESASPIIANTVLLSASQRLGQDWQLAELGSFSLSTGATPDTQSGVNKLEFTTYRAAIDLYYWVTSMWSIAVGYDYMRFDRESGRVSSQFDRHSVMLSLKAIWE